MRQLGESEILALVAQWREQGRLFRASAKGEQCYREIAFLGGKAFALYTCASELLRVAGIEEPKP